MKGKKSVCEFVRSATSHYARFIFPSIFHRTNIVPIWSHRIALELMEQSVVDWVPSLSNCVENRSTAMPQNNKRLKEIKASENELRCCMFFQMAKALYLWIVRFLLRTESKDSYVPFKPWAWIFVLSKSCTNHTKRNEQVVKWNGSHTGHTKYF